MVNNKYFIIFFIVLFILSSVSTEVFATESKRENNMYYFYNNPHFMGQSMEEPALRISPDTQKPLSDHTGSVDRKDPFLAGLLSWFMMGIGQIYCKEYTKGSLFIALDLVDKTTMLLLISYINTKYKPGEGEVIYMNWNAFDNSTKLLVVTYILAKVGLRFYNVVDAINSANSYNRRYSSKMPDKDNFEVKLGKNEVGIGYKIKLK